RFSKFYDMLFDAYEVCAFLKFVILFAFVRDTNNFMKSSFSTTCEIEARLGIVVWSACREFVWGCCAAVVAEWNASKWFSFFAFVTFSIAKTPVKLLNSLYIP